MSEVKNPLISYRPDPGYITAFLSDIEPVIAVTSPKVGRLKYMDEQERQWKKEQVFEGGTARYYLIDQQVEYPYGRYLFYDIVYAPYSAARPHVKVSVFYHGDTPVIGQLHLDKITLSYRNQDTGTTLNEVQPILSEQVVSLISDIYRPLQDMADGMLLMNDLVLRDTYPLPPKMQALLKSKINEVLTTELTKRIIVRGMA